MLVEEGEADPVPSLRRKGNLYLLSHGTQGARLLRGIRDQYLGDPLIGGSVEVSLGVLDSLEASSALLAQREAGVSCLAAVTNAPNRLSIVGAGDFRAFLEERNAGSPQLILAPRYAHKKLAMESPGVIERVQRPLAPGDRVVLCCGPLAQALSPADVTSLVSSQPEASAQELADGLAVLAESAGGGSALVLFCREAEPALATEPFYRASKSPEEELRATESVMASHRRRRKLPLKWLVGVFAAVVIGSAGMDSLSKYISAPAVTLPSGGPALPSAAGKDLMARLDDLWSRGQKGDIAAWKEAIDLLQKLQSVQPGDTNLLDKLRAAELNQQYAEAMGQVAVLWGAGETSAKTVQSWAKAVEVLEDLHGKVGGTGFLKPATDKLYAARINYGKALEAAGRAQEARSLYEKARDLDQSRPEAVDALKRLR